VERGLTTRPPVKHQPTGARPTLYDPFSYASCFDFSLHWTFVERVLLLLNRIFVVVTAIHWSTQSKTTDRSNLRPRHHKTFANQKKRPPATRKSSCEKSKSDVNDNSTRIHVLACAIVRSRTTFTTKWLCLSIIGLQETDSRLDKAHPLQIAGFQHLFASQKSQLDHQTSQWFHHTGYLP